jgi:hypothetical protein
MEFKELTKLEANKIIGCFVLDEHTLGYVFPYFGQLGITALGAKISKGGINWRNGPYLISEFLFPKLRKATEQDFDTFRVLKTENMLKFLS